MKLLKITSKGRQYGDRALVYKAILDKNDPSDVCPLQEAKSTIDRLRKYVDATFGENDRIVFWYHLSQLFEADFDASVGEWRDHSEFWPN